jgi:uncharacterized membrane protein
VNGTLYWVLLTLAQALILHLAAIWYFPRVVSRFSARKLLKFAGRWNTLGYRGLATAGRRSLTTNPDMVTAFGVYDASRGPVRIACVVPSWDSYWSVSLFAWDTNNFYVVNDRTAKSQKFDLLITTRKTPYPASEDEEVVVSPSKKGIVLVRVVVQDRDDPAELARVEDVLRKTVIVARATSSRSPARIVGRETQSVG